MQASFGASVLLWVFHFVLLSEPRLVCLLQGRSEFVQRPRDNWISLRVGCESRFVVPVCDVALAAKS